LYLSNIDGSELPFELEIPKGGYTSFRNIPTGNGYQTDMTKIAYNRIFREFRT
jgi:hypothetical protein